MSDSAESTPPPAPQPPQSPKPELRRPRFRPEPKPPGKPPVLDSTAFPTSGPKLRELDSEIEQELAAAMGEFSEKELMGDPRAPRSQAKPGHGGERKKGKVIRVSGPDVFVSVPGGRSEGVLPLDQFPEGAPAIGTEIEFGIEGYDPSHGLLRLSRHGAAKSVDWSSVAAGVVVEAKVTAVNKGGLSVEVNGIRGFMPMGQIDIYRVEQPEQFINQRLKCVVTEANAEERNLVVSRRDLLERDREQQREAFWAGIEEGQIRSGVVRSARPFGAFVDLGGADGLIPVSELSWTRVNDPLDVVKIGQRVEVKVIRVDRAARKIGLSLKALAASPWDAAAEKYHPGVQVFGRVTRTAEFGAFVELEPGVEGLIHISELSPSRVRRVVDVVQVGQQVEVRVLSVDLEQRRMSLSLKALAEAKLAIEQEEDEEPYVPTPRPVNPNLRGGLGE